MLQEELKRWEATLGRTEAIEKFFAKTEEAIQQWQKYFKDAVQYNAAHPENSEIARAWKNRDLSRPKSAEFLTSCIDFLVAFENELGKREGGEGPWIQCWIDMIEMLERHGLLPEAEKAVSERTKLAL